jgi:hypothetical protein
MCVLSLGLLAFQPLRFDLLLMVRAVLFSGRCALGGVFRWIRIEMRSFKWTTFTALVFLIVQGLQSFTNQESL